ncbi:hypothetical protein ODJ79_24080 [Actinoplanes sp. KI2]|uniref:hypothetical protein n=1 Tax=Actinoplanes sp. KI2 TaxID=2983315 RepID=UPI0021D5E3C4|nr:hypothetical protein [Actinoplanes sp. KI2]MCU7726820.1 hypothetical protein [Actinoplanes sp. KI2]
MLDRLLSRTGPEAPPDLEVPPPVIDEPTQKLKVVLPSIPQRVAARAVIVYEQAPRRPWRLWGFTAVLVALTIGVVLGQAEAFQPVSRGANAQAATVPSAAPTSVAPAAAMTAPLGTAKALVFEVTGDASSVHIASADLGDRLYSIVPIGVSVPPRITDSPRGPRLVLARTGAEVRLSAKVSWTVRLAATSSEQTVDMRAGGLAAIELTGASARTELTLPRPRATVKVNVLAPVGALRVSTVGVVPVRLRLDGGAQTAVIGGKTHQRVKPHTTLTPAGWKTAKTRYDVSAAAALGSVFADHL